MSYVQLANQIKKTDEVLAKFEVKTIDRLESFMDAAFKALEREFRRKWLATESTNLAGKDRAILILGQLKNYLSLLPSDSSEVDELYEDLVKDARSIGLDFGASAIETITGFSPSSTANINIKAIAFQAQDASKRLYRHDTDFQLAASQIIQQGLVSGSGVAKVAAQLRQQLGVSKAKAETIARTESMAAMDSAARDTYKSNGIEYVQRIGTQDDRICAFCAARAGNVYEADKAPSLLHPRDRCFNSPFRREWLDAGLVDVEWLKEHRSGIMGNLAAQNKTPDNGPSPFERMNGGKAPKPIWTIAKGYKNDPNHIPR